MLARHCQCLCQILTNSALPQGSGNVGRDAKHLVQIKIRKVGFPEDRPKLGLDLPLQDLSCLSGYVDGAAARNRRGSKRQSTDRDPRST
jgi:hypothetical protein